MKKKLILISGILISCFLLSSCSAEEALTTEKRTSIMVSKTEQMLNFEKSLKVWFNTKKEKGSVENIDAKIISDTESSAIALLKSLDFNNYELIEKSIQDTDELVRLTMKEYSKKLSEMYKNNK